MNLDKAMAWLEAGLDEQGLRARGWTAAWDRATTRFGACWPAKRRITISKPLTELNDEDQVRDTIAHELAHAIVFERWGLRRGHGPEWKAVALALGATPKATADRRRAKLPTGRYALVHADTGEVFRTYQRRPKIRDWRRRYIRGRRAETIGKLRVVPTEEQRS